MPRCDTQNDVSSLARRLALMEAVAKLDSLADDPVALAVNTRHGSCVW